MRGVVCQISHYYCEFLSSFHSSGVLFKRFLGTGKVVGPFFFGWLMHSFSLMVCYACVSDTDVERLRRPKQIPGPNVHRLFVSCRKEIVSHRGITKLRESLLMTVRTRRKLRHDLFQLSYFIVGETNSYRTGNLLKLHSILNWQVQNLCLPIPGTVFFP